MTAAPKPSSPQEGFFWKTKTLEEMSNAEWESLCDGCARCCLEKLEDEDTGKIYFTHVSCKLLDAGLCTCKDYGNRSDLVPDCVRLTPENVRTLNWLPPSCGYKLVAEGRDLYWWHPLISGDPNTVHEAGVSVRGRVQGTENEIADADLEDHIVQWPSHLPVEVIDISDAPPIAPKAPLTQSEVRTILMSLMLTMFLAALDQTIVATALPTIGRQFQDVTNLSWVITAYLLASNAVAPVFGTLSDIYGRRAMIILAMSLFVAGSVLCALAPNMPVLILARGLQGLGGGGILPIVQTVISDVVTPRERGQYQAYFSGVWVAAGVGGPILGGGFAEHLHWSMIFWINVPLGLGSLALLLPKMGKIPVFHRRRQGDWLGGLLLMASAVGFMLVLTWGGNRFSWASPVITAMIRSGVALALAFVMHARRSDEPFLPLPLMGRALVPYAIAACGCAL